MALWWFVDALILAVFYAGLVLGFPESIRAEMRRNYARRGKVDHGRRRIEKQAIHGYAAGMALLAAIPLLLATAGVGCLEGRVPLGFLASAVSSFDGDVGRSKDAFRERLNEEAEALEAAGVDHARETLVGGLENLGYVVTLGVILTVGVVYVLSRLQTTALKAVQSGVRQRRHRYRLQRRQREQRPRRDASEYAVHA